MIQQGLASAEAFLSLLHSSYQEYWHDVGVPKHISDLSADLAKIWDFENMCENRSPDEAHLDSLDRVYATLRQRLALVRWPQSPEFNYVRKEWPLSKELRRQYKVLWYKVHLNRTLWLSPRECQVCLVKPPSILVTLLGRKLQEQSPVRRAIKAVDITCVVFSIATFLWKPPRSFNVRAESIAALKCCEGDTLQPGAFAIMKKAPFKQKLVFVLHVAHTVEPASVVATFCLDPSFHRYKSTQFGETHCWHATFLLAVSATCQGASSVCERIGSFLHGLEAGESVIHPARVADRLRIKVAQVEARRFSCQSVSQITDNKIIRAFQTPRFELGTEVMHPLRHELGDRWRSRRSPHHRPPGGVSNAQRSHH